MLDACKRHNAPGAEGKVDGVDVGEILDGFEWSKLKKRVQGKTHAVYFGHGGGRTSTFAFFDRLAIPVHGYTSRYRRGRAQPFLLQHYDALTWNTLEPDHAQHEVEEKAESRTEMKAVYARARRTADDKDPACPAAQDGGARSATARADAAHPASGRRAHSSAASGKTVSKRVRAAPAPYARSSEARAHAPATSPEAAATTKGESSP